MSSFWNRFARHSAIMRQAATAKPVLLQRLADAPDKTVHVYAIALDHRLSHEPALAATTAAAYLTAHNLTQLLAEAWGANPPGALTALNRCGATVESPTFYILLRRCLSEDRLATLLRAQCHPISLDRLEKVIRRADLDPALDVIPDPIRTRDLAGIDWLVRQLRAVKGKPLSEKWLRAALRDVSPGRTRKPILRLLGAFPPVPAPWGGDDMLRPVETVEALRTLAGKMKNCLDQPRYALGLVQGRDAFYFRCTGEPIVVHVRKADDGSWAIAEMNGAANRRPNPDEVLSIQRAMARGGIAAHEHPLHHLKELLDIW